MEYKPYLRNCIGKFEKEVLLQKKMRQGMTKAEAETQMRKENGVLIRQEKAKIYNTEIPQIQTKTSKEQIFDLLTTANEKSNKNVNHSKEFSYEEYWEKHK